MASRTELKAKFAAGQSIKESDFTSLIDSLAHLTDDVQSGELASGSQVSSIQTSMDALRELAEKNKEDIGSVSDNTISTQEFESLKALLQGQINTGLSDVTATQNANNLEQRADIDDLKSRVPSVESDVEKLKVSLSQGLYEVERDYMSKVQYEGQETYLEGAIEGKADKDHKHEEYLEDTDIENLVDTDNLNITLSGYSQSGHTHAATQVSGLNDLFMTPGEIQQLINANKVVLDENFTIADEYYSKDEVEEKFYVARWRTDQVSLFNPSVVSIATPIVSLAAHNAAVSLANFRASTELEFEATRVSISAFRNECMVSIGRTNNTVEAHRLAFTNKDIELQQNINQVSINATSALNGVNNALTLSIANARADAVSGDTALDQKITSNANDIVSLGNSVSILESRSSGSVDDIGDIQVSISTIKQTTIPQSLVDAKAYTDEKITSLVNGADTALDTLKELGDALTQGDADLATSITNNITEVNNTTVSLGNRLTNVELRATSLENKDAALVLEDERLADLISDNAGEISDIKVSISSLKQDDLQVLADAKAYTDSEVTLITNNELATLQESYNTLQNSYNALSEKYDNLQGSYDYLVEKIDAIEAHAYSPYNPGSYAAIGYVFP